MTAEELLERYAAGERDFSGVDLEGADLRGAELGKIKLDFALLIGTNFEGVFFNGKEFGRGMLNRFGAFYYYTIMPDGTTLVGPEYGR